MCIVVALGDFTLYSNVTIPTSSNNGNDPPNSLRRNFYATNQTFFQAVHCFGEFDWYVDYDSPPNTTSYDDKIEWDPSSTGPVVGTRYATPVYFLFVCKNTYSDHCAVFDLIVTNGTTNISDVTPDNFNHAVTGQVANNGDSGSVTFHATGKSEDWYNVYWQTTSQPAGYYTSTACSVRGWMQNFTEQQGTVKNNNDGTYTVNVPTLDSKEEFTVTVVVNRNGGYSNVYDSFVLNDGAAVVPVLLTLLLSVILSMF